MKKVLYLLLFIMVFGGIFFLTRCEDGDYVWKLSSKKYTYVTLSVVPTANTAVAVNRNSSFVFIFSQSMNTSTLGSNDFSMTSSAGTVSQSAYTWSWATNNTILTFTAINPYTLAQDSIYSMRLSSTNLRSSSENPMEADFTGSYTSSAIADTTKPTVTGQFAISNGSQVPVSGTINPFEGIQFQFDEAMSPGNVASAFTLIVNGIARTPSSTVWNGTNTQVTFYFPSLPAGTAYYTLSTFAQDISGNGIASAITSTTFNISGGIIDYTISNFSVTSGTPSTSIGGTFTIQNIGSLDGGQPVKYQLYYNTSASLSGATQIMNSSTGALVAGGTVGIGITGSWPAGAGTYYLIAVVTATDDTNSTNNTVYSSAIPVGIPDNGLVSVSAQTGGPAGSAISGSFSIQNISTVTETQSISYNVFLSIDNSYTTTGDQSILLSGTVTPPLNAGAVSGPINYNGTWPITTGSYNIIIVITSTDDVNTSNNVSIQPVTVTNAVDYSVTSVIMSSTNYYVGSVSGDSVSGVFTVQNIGTGNGTTGFNYVVHVSTSTTSAGSLGTVASGSYGSSLNASSSVPVVFNGSWPTTTTAGTRYLVVVISGMSGDSNATNDTNYNTSSFTILTFSTPSVTASDNLYLNYIRLSGYAVTGASGYYINRRDYTSGSYSQINNTTATTFDDYTTAAINTYSYTVQAYRSAGALTSVSTADDGSRLGSVLFWDDFEGGPGTVSNTWTNQAPASYTFYDAQSSVVYAGSYSLRLTGGLSGQKNGLRQNLGGITPTYISYYVRVANTQDSGNFKFFDSTDTNMPVALFCSGGRINIYGSTNYSISNNVWYHVEFKNINWSTQRYDIYINGTLISANDTFNASSPTLGVLYLTNWSGTGDAFYDNIEMRL